MPLVSTAEILRAAGAVGAFNVVQLEHASAIVAGAVAAGTPVILEVSENTVRYHGGLAPIGSAVLAIARAAAVRNGRSTAARSSVTSGAT